jgi:hypothetical protein
MNDEFESLEKRLKKLVPLDREALAARILGLRPSISREDSPPASAPRRRRRAPFSLSSALAGAILGAAATFLAMICLVPPRIELREVARVEAKPAVSSPHSTAQSGSEETSSEQSAEKMTRDRRLAASIPSIRELDALLAEQEARARRMARYEANFSSASKDFTLPRISPAEYREILRELKL